MVVLVLVMVMIMCMCAFVCCLLILMGVTAINNVVRHVAMHQS
jgi:hypothetical protein